MKWIRKDQTGWNRGKPLVPDGKEGFFLSGEAILIFKLLKRDRYYLLLIITLFAGAILLGEYLPKLDPTLAQAIEQAVTSHLSGIAGKLKHLPFWIWILEIWLNNITAAFMALILGMILSPALPLAILIGNGMIVGLFQRKMELIGLSASRYYLGLLPHGFFELPAFFIAIMMGIHLGITTYRLLGRYLKGERTDAFLTEYFKEIHNYVYEKGRFYGVLVIILFFIAAIFEVMISPTLLKR